MAYVPGFRYDLFLSYASEDNAGDWVVKFEQHLTAELGRLLGRPFSSRTVFFDKRRLAVGQQYPDELDEAARGSALLLPLLSPNYLASNWCSRERNVFQHSRPPGVSFHQSLAAVAVRPVGALPDVLDKAQQLSFVIREFAEPWPAESGTWFELVNKLAVQIEPLLRVLRSKAGKVFVGAPLPQHMDLRDNLAAELSDLHFRATPDPVALLDDPAQRQQALAEAACAVHFIGGATDDALTVIEESVRLCPGKTVLFTPFGAKLTAAEEGFLAELSPCPERTGPVESELRKFLEDLLTTVRRAAQPVPPASLGVICEPQDFAFAAQFRPEGLSVTHPAFLSENLMASERIRRWRDFLRNSHGLLFYQGASDEARLERVHRMADEAKVDAPRRWYLAEPDLPAKRERRPNNPTFPEGLDDFLDEVRRRSRQ